MCPRNRTDLTMPPLNPTDVLISVACFVSLTIQVSKKPGCPRPVLSTKEFCLLPQKKHWQKFPLAHVKLRGGVNELLLYHVLLRMLSI